MAEMKCEECSVPMGKRQVRLISLSLIVAFSWRMHSVDKINSF